MKDAAQKSHIAGGTTQTVRGRQNNAIVTPSETPQADGEVYAGRAEGRQITKTTPTGGHHQVHGVRKFVTVALFAAMAAVALPGMAHAQEVTPQPQQTTQTDGTQTKQTDPKAATTQTNGGGLATPNGVVTVPVKQAPSDTTGTGKAAPPAGGQTQGGGLANPNGVVTVPTPTQAGDNGDPHAHDFGRFHIGGDVDNFDSKHSKGIDAGDWQAPLDNYQGGFMRGEFVRNFRLDGLSLTHGDSDKGFFAGVELGGLRARTDNDIHLSGGLGVSGFGNYNGDKGFNLQIEGDQTIGLNIARFNVHNTQDLGHGNSNEYGVRGYLNATAEYDLKGNFSSNTQNTPNGFVGTHRVGVGGQIEGYDSFTHDTDKGTLNLTIHAGEAYNLAGQGVYGNRSDDRANPYVYSTQSYQFKGGKMDGVTLGAREDFQPTSAGNYSRFAVSAEKDVKVFKQDATIGVYAGHEQLGSQGSNFVGAGITFHF